MFMKGNFKVLRPGWLRHLYYFNWQNLKGI